jgi:hypothetical protein
MRTLDVRETFTAKFNENTNQEDVHSDVHWAEDIEEDEQ